MRSVLPYFLSAGLFIYTAPAWAQSNACDLTSDGKVDQSDVQSAINMALGMSSCNANVFGSGVCNVVVVQRVINASLPGGNCLTGTTHTVSLSWNASSSSNVSGYKVYRRTSSNGSYSVISTQGVTTSYTDKDVQSGQTYFYVVTALSGSGESGYSNQAQAIIPAP